MATQGRYRAKGNSTVIILGLILLLVGWLFGVSFLVTLGLIIVVVGVVLVALGALGASLGPHRYYW